VKIGPVVSAENRLTDGNCAATRLQLDDRRPFVGNYLNDLRQPFSLSSHMYGDYKTAIQGRRSHRIIGGDIKVDWASGRRKTPSGVQGRSTGRGSGGPRSYFVKLHIIFALKYYKQQLLSL